MTQEDIEQLLKDLAARLPYHPIVYVNESLPRLKLGAATRVWEYIAVDNPCKPYLRIMSSMTEEEKQEFHHVASLQRNYIGDDIFYTHWQMYDWLNAHHFDYRGLIEKGLAIAVTKENNPYK